MSLVPVEIVNKSKQTVRMTLDADGEQFAYLCKQVAIGALTSVNVVKPAARKPASAK